MNTSLQASPTLSRAYRQTVPYYLVANDWRLQAERMVAEWGGSYGHLDNDVTYMRRFDDRKSAFYVSTDNPGYWYFTKGITKDTFRGSTDEDGVSYLLHALSIGATGDTVLALFWIDRLAEFYATEYRFEMTPQLPKSVYYQNVGIVHERKLWQDRWLHNGREISRTEANDILEKARERRPAERERISAKNEREARKGASEIREDLNAIVGEFVTDMTGIAFEDKELVEGSLIALTMYHRGCWRGPAKGKLERHVDVDRILNPNLYLFSRVHKELNRLQQLPELFLEDDAGILETPVNLWVRCGNQGSYRHPISVP